MYPRREALMDNGDSPLTVDDALPRELYNRMPEDPADHARRTRHPRERRHLSVCSHVPSRNPARDRLYPSAKHHAEFSRRHTLAVDHRKGSVRGDGCSTIGVGFGAAGSKKNGCPASRAMPQSARSMRRNTPMPTPMAFRRGLISSSVRCKGKKAKEAPGAVCHTGSSRSVVPFSRVPCTMFVRVLGPSFDRYGHAGDYRAGRAHQVQIMGQLSGRDVV